MPKSKTTDDKDQKYLELGKKLQTFYELGYIDKKQTLWFSFLKGLVTGAGAFVGGTLVIALIIWILSLVGTVPLVGPLVDNVSHTLNNRK